MGSPKWPEAMYCDWLTSWFSGETKRAILRMKKMSSRMIPMASTVKMMYPSRL